MATCGKDTVVRTRWAVAVVGASGVRATRCLFFSKKIIDALYIHFVSPTVPIADQSQACQGGVISFIHSHGSQLTKMSAFTGQPLCVRCPLLPHDTRPSGAISAVVCCDQCLLPAGPRPAGCQSVFGMQRRTTSASQEAAPRTPASSRGTY